MIRPIGGNGRTASTRSTLFCGGKMKSIASIVTYLALSVWPLNGNPIFAVELEMKLSANSGAFRIVEGSRVEMDVELCNNGPTAVTVSSLELYNFDVSV